MLHVLLFLLQFFCSGHPLETEIASLFRETFELLAIFLALDPLLLAALQAKSWWNNFILDSLTRMKNRLVGSAQQCCLIPHANYLTLVHVCQWAFVCTSKHMYYTHVYYLFVCTNIILYVRMYTTLCTYIHLNVHARSTHAHA